MRLKIVCKSLKIIPLNAPHFLYGTYLSRNKQLLQFKLIPHNFHTKLFMACCCCCICLWNGMISKQVLSIFNFLSYSRTFKKKAAKELTFQFSSHFLPLPISALIHSGCIVVAALMSRLDISWQEIPYVIIMCFT